MQLKNVNALVCMKKKYYLCGNNLKKFNLTTINIMVTIRVISQSLENYSFLENGEIDGVNPYWKCKGGQVFEIKVDGDFVMIVDKSVMIQGIKTFLERHSNVGWKYEYISHEVIFGNPIVIDSDTFTSEVLDLQRKSMEDVELV
jgi:hypothetical protein